MLLDLNGKTVLERVIERCAVVDGIATVCCAVPSNQRDEPVAEEARRCGAFVVRGSESDVLDRYRQAAEECAADVIVRVTSDCPLIDPALVGKVLALVTSGGAGYSCNNMPPLWPHGLDCEAFTRDWLEIAAREAGSPREREHVTPFLREHPQVKRMNLAGPGGSIARQRWTLDTPADFEFLRAVFAELPQGVGSFDYRVPLAIVERAGLVHERL